MQISEVRVSKSRRTEKSWPGTDRERFSIWVVGNVSRIKMKSRQEGCLQRKRPVTFGIIERPDTIPQKPFAMSGLQCGEVAEPG